MLMSGKSEEQDINKSQKIIILISFPINRHEKEWKWGLQIKKRKKLKQNLS